jgi:iron complex outermembrane recepter protein
MFKKSKVYSGVLLTLGGGLALCGLPSFAQTAERVEITGSRILSLGAASPSPLQVFGADDIKASGVLNLQELLLKNPTLGTPAISRTNSNFATSSAGVSTIDLRDLGTDRTLVLVNGRRYVAGVPGSAAVDLNTIPADFIERVELLTGGASSTYGSDAVAGVVNIILKKRFEGFILDTKGGISQEGDDKQAKVSMTFGTNSADGKGNLMAHFGFSKQGAVNSRDRDFAAVDQASVGVFITGEPDDIFKIQRPFFSSFAPQGRVFISPGVNLNSRTFDANGNIIPFSTNGPAGDGVGATGFNRSNFRTIAIPTNRFMIASKGDYALTDDHNVFFEVTYAKTNTRTVLEPFPLSADDIYPVDGAVAAEFLVNGSLVRNPLVPDGIYSLLTETNADGARVYGFSRRLAEVGNRGNVADRNTMRLLTGVKGTLVKGWDYDLFLNYGSTGESQVSSGQVNVLNFRNALEAIPDGAGGVMCRDATARAQGCSPINIFGFNSVSAAAIKYVSAPQMLSTLTTQKIAGGNISGEAFNLPSGPVGLAAGFEYREEYSRSEFDALTQTGLNAGNAIPRTEGKFDVTEVYAEVRLPLLKGLPAVHSLTLTGAARGAEYSTSGNTTSWNAGLEWAPVSDVKVRLTSAVSTRAPNINELFSPPSQDFPTGLADPCDGVTATTTGTVATRCRAEPGVAANIAANGAFTLNQADQQGISGFNRGNPNVKQEKGKSFTAGLVFSPQRIAALRGFTFTLDYFNIEIDEAIVSTPRQFILDQCYGGSTSFCQFIKRRPAPIGANSAGSLDEIDSAVTNSGALTTKGFDLTVGYRAKVGPGNLAATFAYTRVQDGFLIPLVGSDKDYNAGEVGNAKDRFSLNLGYKFGAFGITSQTTYIGKSALDDQFLSSTFSLPRGSVTVGAKTYNDFQFTYDWKKVGFYFGIDNAFDTKPAPIISGLPGNVTGAETAADIYDAIGRRFYTGVRMTF